ncbi:MAG: sensor histidine kinase [Spirochaetaceae bacterium]
MAQVLLHSPEDELLTALKRNARSLDFSFRLNRGEPTEINFERLDAAVIDLRSETKLPESPHGGTGHSIVVVICRPDQAELAEEAMRAREAHVVFGESTEEASLQTLFTLRRALYEDDKHGTALEAARTTAKRYEDLLQATPDIVYRLDVEGNFTFVNEAIRYLGYAPEDLIGHHFSKILHEGEVERVSREHVLPRYQGKKTGINGAPGLFDERRGRERRTRGMEIRLKGGRRSGAPASMDGVAVAFGEVSATGHYRQEKRDRVFTGTVGIIRDVSWRKRSEKLLHLTSRALEQSVTGVCIFSPEGTIEYANPRYSRMLGIPHDQLLEASMEEIWSRYYRESEFEQILSSTVDGGTFKRDLRCASGEEGELWIDVRAQSVETGEGLTYILLLQDDISERKAQEEKLRHALDEKSVLLQEVHHRVKNNLQVIGSMLSIEAGEDDNRQVREFLEASQRRIRAMALVHDALYHSDTQARLDLSSYLNQVIDGVTGSSNRHVHIERELPESYHVELSFAILFGLVVNELIGYALRNVPATETPRIVLRLQADKEMVLRVSGAAGLGAGPDAGAGVLIVRALAGQLEGDLSFESDGDLLFTLPAP